MNRQVITIGKEGSMTTLDHKKKGVGVSSIGKRSIKRVSEIEFQDEFQMWGVRFLQGQLKGNLAKLHPEHIGDYDKGSLPLSLVMNSESINEDYTNENGEFLFSDYEDAVNAEVKIIQWMQVNGKKNLVFDIAVD